MLTAIVESWEGEDGCHIDKTLQYILLFFFKLSLDGGVMYVCWRGLRASFMSVFSLYVVLTDLAMLCSVTAVWFLEPEKSFATVCFLLAHGSALYAALPMPTLLIGLQHYICADYCGQQSTFCKVLWNILSASLVWALAAAYSAFTAASDLLETQREGEAGVRMVACSVQESLLVSCFVVGLLLAMVSALLPWVSHLPAWTREANRLSTQRDKVREIPKSELMLSRAGCTDPETFKEKELAGLLQVRPPLFLSFTLAFGLNWTPYLLTSAICLILRFGVPAHIAVNLLWLECANSVLTGMVFWLRSDSQGPYNHLSEDISSWSIFWHLSRGTSAIQHEHSMACLKETEQRYSILQL